MPWLVQHHLHNSEERERERERERDLVDIITLSTYDICLEQVD